MSQFLENLCSFGSVTPGRSFTSASYRYGFNGQEKDDEVSGAGNSNTAEFWQYDTRLGRRWNLDPKPQIGISDYNCFGANPIANSDIKGDKFINKSGKDDNSEHDKMKSKMESRKSEILASISEAENTIKEIEDGTSVIPPASTVQQEQIGIEYQNKMLTEVNNALNELEIMKNSNQAFILSPTTMDGGETTYNKQLKAVVMEFNSSSWSTGSHELKHGYQFLQGKHSFNRGGDAGGRLFDKTDEIETYQRQFAMDPSFVITNIAKDRIYIFQASDINIQSIRDLDMYDPVPKHERHNSGMNKVLAKTFGNITVDSKNTAP